MFKYQPKVFFFILIVNHLHYIGMFTFPKDYDLFLELRSFDIVVLLLNGFANQSRIRSGWLDHFYFTKTTTADYFLHFIILVFAFIELWNTFVISQNCQTRTDSLQWTHSLILIPSFILALCNLYSLLSLIPLLISKWPTEIKIEIRINSVL